MLRPALIFLFVAGISTARADDALAHARRILFLGDSITYAGGYVERFEWFLHRERHGDEPVVINAGLPSETVSGLSEAGHAGGAFPRPDLHERLDRVLALVKPDLVFACYGMNDGIYLPLDDGRFTAFRDGITRLHERVERTGARIIHLTPAVFDVLPIRDHTIADPAAIKDGQMFAGYDGVLDRYSRWLLDQRTAGWSVVDTHGAVKSVLNTLRQANPRFSYAGDGVHPNEEGQGVIAAVLLASLDPARAADFEAWLQSAAGQSDRERKIRALISERSRVLKDAYLTAAGHKRPGMAKGLPVAEADAKAGEISRQLSELDSGNR